MPTLSKIADLLRLPGARVLAMDPTGGQTSPLPTELDAGSATRLTGDNPLDPIVPADHGRAVVAFEAARRRGQGTAAVSIVGEDITFRLEIFNLERSHGCFVAVAVPEDIDVGDAPTETAPAPRQASYRLNATGVFIAVSSDFTDMLGWTEEELLGRSSLDVIHPDDHENGIVAWIDLLEHPTRKCRLRQRFKTTSDEWMWCEVTDTNRLDDPDDPYVLGELLDVSRELAAQAALQRRETLLDRLTQALPSGVLHLDQDGEIEVCNDRWVDLTGVQPFEGIEGLLTVVAHPGRVAEALAAAVDDGLDADLEVTFLSEGAICRFGELHIRPLRNGDTDGGLLLTLDDVTGLRTYQHELAEQTRRDPLTGVRNRFGIEEAVERRLASNRSSEQSPPAVLFLDLDRFKAINDVHGHATGDAVLRLVAEAVGGLLRPDDVLGRLGGDEFLVLLAGGDNRENAPAIAKRIQDAVRSIAGRLSEEVEVGVTIGQAVATADDDFDSLIKRADEAMYAAKRSSTV